MIDRRRASGFSLVELLLALTIGLLVAASAFALMLPSQAVGASRAEAADLQQRVRVAADTLTMHMLAAGAGAYADTDSPLSESFAPILPYRAAGAAPDPPGTFRSDAITIVAVPKSSTTPSTTTYWLKSDDAAGTYQLIANEGSGADIPVVDHVVALSFEYFGDPRPPAMRKPLADPAGPWTTYGARPLATAVAPFGAGENCLFVNPAPAPQPPAPEPRLATLGAGNALVALPAALLTDGPWCPNDAAADRWDADLLRVRSVAVVLRVQAAIAALRGPAGALFRHAGTSHSGLLTVPDQEIRFQVSPRNMNRAR